MTLETAVAVIGTIDVCLKYGKEPRNISSAFKNAESELAEGALKIEVIWHRCIAQLDFIRIIHQTMDESHLALHERTLAILASKLNIATHTFRSLVEARVVEDKNVKTVVFVPKPLKYACKKEKLNETIHTLESWQRMSDPSWFLLRRMHDSWMGNAMAESPTAAQDKEFTPSTSIQEDLKLAIQPQPWLSLPVKDLLNMDISSVHSSTLKIAKNMRADRVITYILDEIDLPDPESYQMTKKNVRDLARRLQHNEPDTFGLLTCKGFVAGQAGPHSESIMMVFRTPSSSSMPQSLRCRLLNGEKPRSLSEGFLIAQELAKSVSYVHVFGFVHKNIRPETILHFERQDQGNSSIFLVGFGELRQEDGKTQRRGDDARERNLYRHSSRQGTIIGQGFVMQHDIYSLGVCLLEIGLWQSFLNYDAQAENATLSPVVGISSNASKEDTARFLLTSAKENFVRLARNELREFMGTQYSEIVEICLTCLDPDNSFGNQREFEDEYGIRVGVRYIEKILHRLGGLRV
ncbi:hypothetical protein NW762_007384 [Fusarium torreyae]|uniref:Protein kinase domain-containing protein n=1 Tax=Fusarium torreyae TaxID=1237075 RepID=A0A9W8RZP6_9HYPO|nr:hypothetical protein NW762_007384 [Fusarium torreyae]